ncbi:MAG: hypothetical protein E7353_04630 [Clostridiales bacterium]|nr:hypothetical protein [Clostridiales bacterium]
MSRLVPMFALTGKPKKEQIEEKMLGFLSQGINEIMLYARSGCELEYMTEEWLKTCEDCVLLAEKYGVKLWIYDEFNWPSGSCGGKVAKLDKEFCAKYLEIVDGKIVVRYENPYTSTADDGTMQEKRFSVDMLNPDATRAFISLTHEIYKQKFGQYFGKVILGFFTDEPSFSYYSSVENPAYYDGVWADYKVKYSRDGQKDFLSKDEGFYPRYITLLGERFAKSYLKQINEWCVNNDLIFTGHLFLDSGIKDAIKANGEILCTLAEFGMPGVDKITNRVNPSKDFLFSYATYLRKKGKTDVMGEMFALGPCSLPYARKRQMLWYAAAYGVSKYFVAVSHLDLRGNKLKIDYFHDFSPSSPDFTGAKELEKTAELASIYANKKPLEEIVIKYPYQLLLKEYVSGEKLIDERFLGLIDHIIKEQYTYVLAKEDDEKCGKMCIRFTQNGYTDEISGKNFNSIDEIISFASTCIDRKIKVLNEDLTLATNVLVRNYKDGSFVILDRNVNAIGGRNLLLKTSTTTTQIFLNDFGVYLSEDKEETFGDKLNISNISYFYCNDNFYRPHFMNNDNVEFFVENDLQVELYKRVDESETIYLDGNLIEFNERANSLPRSMSKLYVKSNKVALIKGRHCLQTQIKDFPFLPSVLISGDFNINKNLLISRDKNKVANERFYGCAGITFNVDLPQNHSAKLKYNSNNLVSEVYVDGVKVETNAYAPCFARIPKEYSGRNITIKIACYSSYAPLWGDFMTATNTKDLFQYPPARLAYNNKTLFQSVPEKLNLTGIELFVV